MKCTDSVITPMTFKAVCCSITGGTVLDNLTEELATLAVYYFFFFSKSFCKSSSKDKDSSCTVPLSSPLTTLSPLLEDKEFTFWSLHFFQCSCRVRFYQCFSASPMQLNKHFSSGKIAQGIEGGASILREQKIFYNRIWFTTFLTTETFCCQYHIKCYIYCKMTCSEVFRSLYIFLFYCTCLLKSESVFYLSMYTIHPILTEEPNVDIFENS